MHTRFASTVRALAPMLRSRPQVAVIAGSGIMAALPSEYVTQRISMSLFSEFPIPTVAGHGAEVVEMHIAGVPVLLFSGRIHAYEGLPQSMLTANVQIAHALGLRHLVVTNAAGALDPLMHCSDVVLPHDVIDLTFANARNPGPAPVRVDAAWRERAIRESLQRGIRTSSGVYAQVVGPSYETRAEIRMLRTFGANLVGMSTAVEAGLACSLGMHVVICSLISNVLTDSAVRNVSHTEVLQTARSASEAFVTVLESAVRTADGLSL